MLVGRVLLDFQMGTPFDPQTAMDTDSIIAPIDDLWSFDIEASSWWKWGNLEGPNPRPRSLHAALALGGKMFIFGGVAHGPRLLMNDVWALDMGARKWEEVSVAKDLASPIPREGHSMVAGPENVANSFTILEGWLRLHAAGRCVDIRRPVWRMEGYDHRCCRRRGHLPVEHLRLP